MKKFLFSIRVVGIAIAIFYSINTYKQHVHETVLKEIKAKNESTERWYQKIIPDKKKIKYASLSLDSADKTHCTYYLSLSVYDSIDLIEPFKLDTADKNKQLSHDFLCQIKKDIAHHTWKVKLNSYSLHRSLTVSSSTGNFRYGDYPIDIMRSTGTDTVTVYGRVCDHCKLSDFVWLQNKPNVKLGDNIFMSTDSALKEIAPPYAYEIFNKIQSEIPLILKD